MSVTSAWKEPYLQARPGQGRAVHQHGGGQACSLYCNSTSGCLPPLPLPRTASTSASPPSQHTQRHTSQTMAKANHNARKDTYHRLWQKLITTHAKIHITDYDKSLSQHTQRHISQTMAKANPNHNTRKDTYHRLWQKLITTHAKTVICVFACVVMGWTTA